MPTTSENSLIEQLLEDQQQVIDDLDQLNARVLSAIEAIAAQRKAEQAESDQDSNPAQDQASKAA